jgi:hypothetical protein
LIHSVLRWIYAWRNSTKKRIKGKHDFKIFTNIVVSGMSVTFINQLMRSIITVADVKIYVI